MRTLSIVLILCLALAMTACGGGGGTPVVSPSTRSAQPIAIAISPTAATVAAGGTLIFTVQVTGSQNGAVTWQVVEGTSGGSVSGQGGYSAPQVAGTYHVEATSVADPGKIAVALVTVTAALPPPANISVSVSPSSATLGAGGTLGFSATVTGTGNTAVTWTVVEGATGGLIDGAGLYSAPQTAGTYHVQARSQADSSKVAIATVNVVQPAIAYLAIYPAQLTALATGTYTFYAVAYDTNGNDLWTSVTWSVTEGNGGGTLAPSGPGAADYKAPLTGGTYHVVATSTNDPNKTATATVTVEPAMVVVSPHSEVLGPNSIRQFYSKLPDGTFNPLVTWGIAEGIAGGTVSSDLGFRAFYQSPQTVGTYHIVARSTADTSQYDTATVSVVPSGFHGTILTADQTVTTTALTATLLPDGRVLAAGGLQASFDWCCGWIEVLGPTSATNLFNPVSGSFVAGPPMVTARSSHTATLLKDGTVLVTGGFSGAGNLTATNAGEIYDPAKGSFSPTGDMVQARAGHTATLLADGTVLIVGGATGVADPTLFPFSNGLSSAEIYDPASGKFTAVGSLQSARYAHTATLLNTGKVLVAGGFAGSGGAESAILSAELYDPAQGTFSAAGNMYAARGGHTAALLPNNNVLIAGGTASTSTSALQGVLSGEIYDVFGGTFAATGAMQFPHAAGFAVLLGDGTVLIGGGFDNATTATYTAELYAPLTGSFQQTGSMDCPRAQTAATLLPDATVLVVGGCWDTSTSATTYK